MRIGRALRRIGWALEMVTVAMALWLEFDHELRSFARQLQRRLERWADGD